MTGAPGPMGARLDSLTPLGPQQAAGGGGRGCAWPPDSGRPALNDLLEVYFVHLESGLKNP